MHALGDKDISLSSIWMQFAVTNDLWQNPPSSFFIFIQFYLWTNNNLKAVFSNRIAKLQYDLRATFSRVEKCIQEICYTTKPSQHLPNQNQWRCSGVFIVNFEQISRIY